MANFSFASRITDGTAVFNREEYRHVITVLRKKTGDQINFLDGRGGTYSGIITAVDAVAGTFAAEVTSHRRHPPAIPPLTLALALPKGKKFSFVIQKAVELGISRIMPLETRYAVKQLPAKSRDRERKFSQWRKTALEAAKQCGNPYLPDIHSPLPLSSLPLPAAEDCVKLLFHGQAVHGIASQAASLARAREVIMIIGPEGGFSPDEVAYLDEHDCRTIHLGPNILRLETAVIAATAVVRYLTEAPYSPIPSSS